MNGTAMIIPVTPKLAAEMAGAAHLIRAMEAKGRKVNDHDHFVKAVGQLETLTVAVLAATSSTQLTGRVTPLARFSMYSAGPLNKHVIDCVAYLRDTATELLHSGGFDRYVGSLTDTAMRYLKQLEGMIRSAVVKSAEADLATLSGAGINELLAAATALAKATAAPVGLSAKIEARESNRMRAGSSDVQVTAATATRPRMPMDSPIV